MGSSLALRLRRQFPGAPITVLDSLTRAGSELNVPRLRAQGIEFIQGDVRDLETVMSLPPSDVLIDCSAEPSILAGIADSALNVFQTNTVGTVHCLEYARRHGAALLFISTSRVYSIDGLRQIPLRETDSRFDADKFTGVGEDFSTSAPRTLYGTTKLASELLIQEYAAMFGVRALINRCGVIAGPWQMGKVDQGFLAFWVAKHILESPLKYIGYAGSGKQVRDVLHIDDLCDLVITQLQTVEEWDGSVFNAGGGSIANISLKELTALCEARTGNSVKIEKVLDDRPGDVPYYVTDNSRVTEKFGWVPVRTVEQCVSDTADWIDANRAVLNSYFA